MLYYYEIFKIEREIHGDGNDITLMVMTNSQFAAVADGNDMKF